MTNAGISCCVLFKIASTLAGIVAPLELERVDSSVKVTIRCRTMSQQALHSSVNCCLLPKIPAVRPSPLRVKATRAQLSHKVRLASPLVAGIDDTAALNDHKAFAGPALCLLPTHLQMRCNSCYRGTCHGTSCQSGASSPARGVARHQETHNCHLTCAPVQAGLAEDTQEHS